MRNDDGDSPAREEWEDCGFALHGDGGRLRARFDRDGVDRILSEIQGIQDTEKAGNTKQPDVQDGYWETLAETATGITKNGVRGRDVVPVNDVTLESLIPLALAKSKEVLQVRLDDNDPNFVRILSAQQAISVSILNTAIKADENRFRQRKNNILEDILTKIRQAEKPVLTLESVS